MRANLLIQLWCTCMREDLCEMCGCVQTNKKGISFDALTALIRVCKHGVINSLSILCQQRHTVYQLECIFTLAAFDYWHGWALGRMTASGTCEFADLGQSSSTIKWSSSNTKENRQEEYSWWRLLPPPLAVLRASSSYHCSLSSTDPPGSSSPWFGLLMTLSSCLCCQASTQPRGANSIKPKNWWWLFPTDSGRRLLLSPPQSA